MLKKKSLAIISAGIIACSLIVAVAASQSLNNVDTNQEVSAPSATTIQYEDVSKDNWFYNDVVDISQKGLMNGTSDTTFSPTDNTNRAMIVTILWRLEGKPIEGENNFTDVAKGQYYYDAVSWATKNKIVSGYDIATFAQTDAATREQLVTIMYRYAEYKNCDLSNTATLYKFTDSNSISKYAIKALEWGVANEIITGTSDSTLSPTDYVQRCQVAAILNRFCNKYNFFGNDNKNDDNITNSETNNNTETNSGNVEEKPAKDENTSEEITPPIYGGGPSDEDDDVKIPEENTDMEGAIIKTNIGYGKPGENVSITLDLQDNPGILGMILSLEYDETAMKLVNVTNGDAVSDILTLTPSKTLASGVRFVWDGLDLTPADIKDGTLLNLEFELFEDVTIGKRYPLTLKYTPGDILDADLNELSLQLKQGYIEVE